MDFRTLTQGISGCECGKDHLCPIDVVEVSSKALDTLAALCRSYQNIVLLADENTWAACGKAAAEKLNTLNPTVVVLTGKERLVPNEPLLLKQKPPMPPKQNSWWKLSACTGLTWRPCTAHKS